MMMMMMIIHKIYRVHDKVCRRRFIQIKYCKAFYIKITKQYMHVYVRVCACVCVYLPSPRCVVADTFEDKQE